MQKKVESVLANLRAKAQSSVITEEDYLIKRDGKVLGDFYYCRKVKNSPFGKGALKDIQHPQRNMLYCFAKEYVFYLSDEFGLVKILKFKVGVKRSFKVFHEDTTEFFFDKSNLILIQEKENKNGKK